MTKLYEEENQFSIPDVDYSIVMGIYHIKKEVENHITTKLQSELSTIQIEVLSNLVTKRCKTSTDLANRLRVSKANLTGVLQRLENKGIISRKVDENDARSKILMLTPKGEEIANFVIPGFLNMMSTALEGLNDEQKDVINNGLAHIFYALKDKKA